MSSFSDTLKTLGPARIAMLGGVFISLIVFFIFVSTQVAKPNLSLLYADLSTIDSSAVAAKLEEDNIVYQVSPDGSRVMVSETDIGRARMLLAQAGLPNGGSLGYELFDKQSSFGTTSFVQNINKQRALQGELARTISSLDPIRSATVNIVLPERELFSRESTQASASVTLVMKQGMRLSDKQIYGIQNLVANAVPGLNSRSVTIVDSQANILASGDEDADSLYGAGGSMRAEELRIGHEKRLQKAVEDILGRVVGPNKVRAQVRVDLDFDRITTNSEIYDPEGQVVRSTQSVSEENRERQSQSNAVTVENNLPGLANGGLDLDEAPAVENNRAEEVTNYEISKTIQSVVRESGEIKKLSVAVIVDGTYTTDSEGNRSYAPRSDEQMDQIAAIVRSAVGLDSDRGDTLEVINMPFAEVEVEESVDDSRIFGVEKSKILETVEMLMVIIMGLLVLLLVIKPMLSHMLATMSSEEDEIDPVEALLEAQKNPALAAPKAEETASKEEDSLLDMQAVEGKVKASTVKKVGDIVTTHPNETVSVIRNWMSQE
jgi:flagellar M-ring protein FliF